MTEVTGSSISCGVHQLYGLDSPDLVILRTVINRDRWVYVNGGQFHPDPRYIDGCFPKGREPKGPQLMYFMYKYPPETVAAKQAFIIFSDADRNKNGIRFAACIRANKLGELMESASSKNPNSGNKIRVWVWQPDRDAIQKYIQSAEEAEFALGKPGDIKEVSMKAGGLNV